MRRETLSPDALPGPDPFTRALLVGEGPAARHLPRLPLDAAGHAAAAKAARGALARPSGALVDALVSYQRERGTGAKAAANASALGAGALAVVTGQQPGLFGGPLLALHKAAGAIALARRVEEAGGGRVVPVFWVASEDHDFAEANRAAVIDADGALRSLSLAVAGDLRSVRDVPLPDPALRTLLSDLGAALPATERAAGAVALAAPPPGADLGSWFAACLARWLGDSGLVVVEPHVVAPFAGATYAALVRDADLIGEAVRAAGARLRADGLAPPLDPPAGSAPLFLRDADRGRRLRVSFDGDRVLLRKEASGLRRADLAERVSAEPELASGDVVGRVFVQDALLPVLAYVGGPTECAYLAQVRAAHEAVGARFPLVAPRPQATWLEAKVSATLDVFGLTPGDVLGGRAPSGPVPAAGADAVVRQLEETRHALAGSAERLRDVPAVAKALRDLLAAIDKVSKSAAEEREARSGRGRARWEKALVSLRPGGQPQERVLSPVSLVARHGVDALREGLSLLDPLAAGHQLLRLD